MLKKIIIIFASVLVLAGVILGVAVSRVVKYDPAAKKYEIMLAEKDRSLLKAALREVKRWVYREATLHNPAGDVLPDELDDQVLQGIKDKIKQ